MNKNFLLSTRFFVCFIIILLIQPVLLLAGWKAERESLDQLYKIGDFRLFYTFNGANSLPLKNRADINRNSVPDYIEHIGLKLHLASIIFSESFGLMHPLQSHRYKNKASYIDVHMLNLESKGSSGDGVHHFEYKILPSSESKSLAIKLSVNLRDRTLTPSHELFHLFQNGYTMFKNRWYTEGTARWSEYAQKEGTGSRENLPRTIEELEKLLQKTYKTKSFWRRLAYLLDKHDGTFPYPLTLQKSVVGYPKIIEDNRIYGYNFIKSFLEKLDDMDDKAARDYQLSQYDWEEKRQKSTENNVYILCGLKNAILDEYRGMEEMIEIDIFLKVLDKAIKQIATTC